MADIRTTPPPYSMQINANNFFGKLAKPDASPIFIPKTMTDAKIPTCHKTLIISILNSPYQIKFIHYQLNITQLYYIYYY